MRYNAAEDRREIFKSTPKDFVGVLRPIFERVCSARAVQTCKSWNCLCSAWYLCRTWRFSWLAPSIVSCQWGHMEWFLLLGRSNRWPIMAYLGQWRNGGLALECIVWFDGARCSTKKVITGTHGINDIQNLCWQHVIKFWKTPWRWLRFQKHIVVHIPEAASTSDELTDVRGSWRRGTYSVRPIREKAAGKRQKHYVEQQ